MCKIGPISYDLCYSCSTTIWRRVNPSDGEMLRMWFTFFKLDTSCYFNTLTLNVDQVLYFQYASLLHFYLSCHHRDVFYGFDVELDQKFSESYFGVKMFSLGLS
jgi:hypothetical protein